MHSLFIADRGVLKEIALAAKKLELPSVHRRRTYFEQKD